MFIRKTNTNLKRLKFFKSLLVFAVIQCFLFSIFVPEIYDAFVPVNSENSKQIKIVVDETYYDSSGRSSAKFYIYSNGIKYRFSNFGISGKYSNRELSEMVREGDVLSITYIEKYPFGVVNEKWVVDARTETKVYRSLEEYNARKSPVLNILFFGFIELLFLSVFALYIVFHWKELKLFSYRKKKKRNH